MGKNGGPHVVQREGKQDEDINAASRCSKMTSESNLNKSNRSSVRLHYYSVGEICQVVAVILFL